jgi:hypothetical protein
MTTTARATSRALNAGLLLTLVAWTAYWAHYGWGHMLAESIVAREGFGGDGIQLWELFNLQMAFMHCVVRWAPGALLLLGGFLYLRRRATAAAAPAAAGYIEERSLAA